MDRRVVSTVCFVLLLMIATAFAQQNPVAVITELAGDVSYLKDAEAQLWGTAILNMPLRVGNAIRIGKNGHVKLLFESGKLITVQGETTYVVPSDPKTDQSVSTALKNMWVAITGKFKRSYSQDRLDAIPTVRGEGEMTSIGIIVSPRNTKVFSTNPSFIWISNGTQAEFKVTIYQGDRIVWSGVAKGDHLVVPNPEKVFLRGKSYKWTVSCSFGLGVEISHTAEFTIASVEEANMTKAEMMSIENSYPDSPSKYMILGSFFERNGFYADALEYYLEYVRRMNHAHAAVLLLCDFYIEHGVPEMAKQALLNMPHIPNELMNQW